VKKLGYQKVIEAQSKMVSYLQARVAKLEREKADLEKLLFGNLTEQTVSYRKLKGKFTALEQPVLELIIKLCNRYKRAVSYDEITRSPEARRIKAKSTTIMRRIRKLKEDGDLTSPKPGYFYPNVKKESL
jgi:hypothetical protein